MDIRVLECLGEFFPQLYVAILSEVPHSDELDAQGPGNPRAVRIAVRGGPQRLAGRTWGPVDRLIEHARPGLPRCLHARLGRLLSLAARGGAPCGSSNQNGIAPERYRVRLGVGPRLRNSPPTTIRPAERSGGGCSAERRRGNLMPGIRCRRPHGTSSHRCAASNQETGIVTVQVVPPVEPVDGSSHHVRGRHDHRRSAESPSQPCDRSCGSTGPRERRRRRPSPALPGNHRACPATAALGGSNHRPPCGCVPPDCACLRPSLSSGAFRLLTAASAASTYGLSASGYMPLGVGGSKVAFDVSVDGFPEEGRHVTSPAPP